MLDLREKTLSSIKWGTFANVAVMVMKFAFGIVWARVLDPADFGIVSMVTIFFTLSSIFIDSGMGQALIRKKNLTDTDISSVFFFNIGMATFFAIILFVASPFIADFYNVPILSSVVKIMAVSMIISSMGSVQGALINRNVNFKSTSVTNIIVSLTAGTIGILLAYWGAGVYALVWKSLIASLLTTISLWYISGWWPRLTFSYQSIKELFGFSGKLVINSIMSMFYNDGIGTLIGKFYSPAALGYFNKGQSTAQLPTGILGVIVTVTYPLFSKFQDDKKQLENIYLKAMRSASLIICFSQVTLAVLSAPYVIFFFTEKWANSIIYLQIFAFCYSADHVHRLNWNYLLALGRSDLALIKEFVNQSVLLLLIYSAVAFSPLWVAIAITTSSAFSVVLNSWFTKKVSGMSFWKQLSEFFYYLFIAVLVNVPSMLLVWSPVPVAVKLFLGVPLSVGCLLFYLVKTKDRALGEMAEFSPFVAKLHRIIQNTFHLR